MSSNDDLLNEFGNDPIVEEGGVPVPLPAVPPYLNRPRQATENSPLRAAPLGQGVVVREMEPETFGDTPTPVQAREGFGAQMRSGNGAPRRQRVGPPQGAARAAPDYNTDTNHVLIDHMAQTIKALEAVPGTIKRIGDEVANNILNSVVERVSPQLAEIDVGPIGKQIAVKAEASVNAARISDAVSAAVLTKVTERVLSRPLMFAVAVAIAIIFIVGCLVGVKIESMRLSDAYTERVQGLGYLPGVMRTRTGSDVAALASVNVPQALEDITQCRAAAGLHLVKATHGGLVCVGSEYASRGWRVTGVLER